MTAFAARRLRNATLSLALLALIGTGTYLYHLALHDDRFVSGWLLVGAFVILAAFNARKKLPFLPLAKAASWLQLHIWLGLLTIAVFAMHAGLGWPKGAVETVLWLLFVGLLASGLFGLLISRIAPRTLTEHGERVLFERIPELRRHLAEEVERLATASVQDLGSGTIASYYVRRLQPYFARPRHVLLHLCGSTAPRRRLQRELRSLERYLSESGRETLNEIEDRVVAKDNLDYQYAWQGLLKGWLFTHVPLTYATAVVAVVHVVLVHAFAASV